MQTPTTINDLCDQYELWAADYYRKPGSRRPTGEAQNIHYALVALRAVAGSQPKDSLSAETLCACQDWMVAQGLCRRSINDRINRIRRMVRWAVRPPRRWLSAALVEDLRCVEPLKLGRTPAPDWPDVEPVDWETVSSTIAHAPLELATMIELQWHTGMRPGEVVRMHKSDLADQRGLILYRPREHKTQHYGIERIIPIGPMGQAVLRPWIARVKGDRLFSLNTTHSYRSAIDRINNEHRIIPWTPNQIRHAAATRLRAKLGLEAARVVLGHASPATTEIYAEVDADRAREAMRRYG